jgi:hypothetical protein
MAPVLPLELCIEIVNAIDYTVAENFSEISNTFYGALKYHRYRHNYQVYDIFGCKHLTIPRKAKSLFISSFGKNKSISTSSPHMETKIFWSRKHSKLSTLILDHLPTTFLSEFLSKLKLGIKTLVLIVSQNKVNQLANLKSILQTHGNHIESLIIISDTKSNLYPLDIGNSKLTPNLTKIELIGLRFTDITFKNYFNGIIPSSLSFSSELNNSQIILSQ